MSADIPDGDTRQASEAKEERAKMVILLPNSSSRKTTEGKGPRMRSKRLLTLKEVFEKRRPPGS